MKSAHSRRSFLAAGLALPAASSLSETPPASTPQAVPLRFRVLGRTGLKVTEVGIGSEAVADIVVLEQALDIGINFFDTARGYQSGNNERILGKALGARWKNVILGSRSYGGSRKEIAADLDASLKALGTDYLDIWYIGSKDNPAEVTDDMLEVQTAAQKAGKVRFKGLSTHRLENWVRILTERKFFDVVLTPYNYPMGARPDEALRRLHQAGVGVVAIKVMAGGNLLRRFFPKSKEKLAALKWVLRNEWIHATSIRTADRDQLEENVQAMTGRFTEEDRKLLAAHIERISPLVCRMCGSCDGICPRGLPVSDMVRYVTYAEGYGHFDMGYERFQQLPEALRAVRCADCRRCVVDCPNGVAVRERLMRAQALFC